MGMKVDVKTWVRRVIIFNLKFNLAVVFRGKNSKINLEQELCIPAQGSVSCAKNHHRDRSKKFLFVQRWCFVAFCR